VTFSASYDLTVKIVSLLVLVAGLGGVVASHSVVVAFILFLVLCLSYAYSARGYVCEGPRLIIKRLVGDVTIPLDGLREARATAGDDFRGCMRLWGNGGLFGYYGLFRTTKLGKCTWYVTNRKKAVVLVTAAKTVVLSPDDVAGFLAAVGPYATAEPVPGQAPPVSATGFGMGRSIGAVVGILIGTLALAAVLFGVLYSPGAPRYNLDSQSLAIRDLFYPVTVRAADVDVERVRVVNLAADADWRPTARTNGFANSHYRSGWFRVANGEKVRMYRADGTRLVLIPARGATVLLEVKDPDRFVDEVRRLWARP
jgi:Bacterial PH domain